MLKALTTQRFVVPDLGIQLVKVQSEKLGVNGLNKMLKVKTVRRLKKDHIPDLSWVFHPDFRKEPSEDSESIATGTLAT